MDAQGVGLVDGWINDSIVVTRKEAGEGRGEGQGNPWGFREGPQQLIAFLLYA